MNKTVFFLTSICICTSLHFVNAQVGINDGGVAPHISAMLDVSSSSRGVLFPRMLQSDRLLISPLTEGLTVYQTDEDKGYYYYDGATWVRLSSHLSLWTDQGDYLQPSGPIGLNLRVADTENYTYGFHANMNTGANAGFGASFNHTNTSGLSYGIYASSFFTGSDNAQHSYGAYILSASTTQDQTGILNYNDHIGSTGSLVGIDNYSHMVVGNSESLTGIKTESIRDGSENENYGVYSSANQGTNVYGVHGIASGGNSNYGLYGDAGSGTLSIGAFAKGGTWGGSFENITPGKSVKLAGLSNAIQIIDGNEAPGKVLTSDATGNGSWQSLPAALWTDHGDYLSPTNTSGSVIRVADGPAHDFGFFCDMNTGADGGTGGLISHYSTGGSSTGIHVAASYSGSGNVGTTNGAIIETTGTTQDQTGIYNVCSLNGSTGFLHGINNYTHLNAINPNDIIGIKNYSFRLNSEADNYGVQSIVEGGNMTYGLYGEAANGVENYGVYGVGADWGGYFKNTSSGKSVKFGGLSYAVEATGDIKLNSASYAFLVGSNDVLHLPNANTLNIAVGINSGPVSTGEHNSYFGYESGFNITSGWDNTMIGYKTGHLKTSGHGNTLLGSAAGFNNSAGNYNVLLGYQAGYSEAGSNKLYISNSNTSNPLIYGEFDNGILKFNGRLGIQTSPLSSAALHVDHNNEYAGYFSSDYASNNTQVVHAVYDGDSYYDAVAVYGESTPLDNYNYGIGGEFIGSFYGVNASSDAGSAGGTAYGVRSICKGTSGTRYGLFSHAESGTIRYGIYAQAAAQTDSYGIYCSGNGVYTGTWTNTSDQMLKKNITEIQDALSIIMQLQPKSYEYKRDEFDFINLAEGKHHGFIAQHLEEVLPELVGTATQPMSDDKNPQMFEFKTANTIELIPILTQAIREQQKLIEELQQQVAQLLQEKE